MAEREKSSHPSVLNGGTPNALVLRTSVSALTTFDEESYAGCNRRWWFSRVLGEKEEEKVAQRIGKEGHAQAEHFEKTGEDTLGPVMRAGKKFLLTGPDVIVEAQFGDLDKAIELRKQYLDTLIRAAQGGNDGADVHDAIVISDEMERVAGLCANYIPLDGYIDYRHARGEYIDSTGMLVKEDPRLGKVVEVGDHKTTSSIELFGKSAPEMASTIQMVGYANYVLNIDPTVDHVRLSHVYYQTRGSLLSKKVTAVVSRDAARQAWKRVDQLAYKMEQVARLPRVEDVEPNKASCDAYKGCDYKSRCPIKRAFGGRGMSLFNKPANGTNGTTTPSAPPPAAPATMPAPSGSLFARPSQPVSVPVVDPARQAAVEAEKQRLAMQDQSFGTCMCGMVLTGANVSRLPSGEVKHIGCPRAGVVPQDAPHTTPVNAAAPMSAEQIAQIHDAEIRARATQHAAASAAQAAAQPQAAQAPAGGRCPHGGQRVQMNDKQKMTRAIACPGCGKDYKAKDDQIDISDGGVFWIVPKHNLPKVEATPLASVPAAAPAPVAAAPAPVAAVPQQTQSMFANTQSQVPAEPPHAQSWVQSGRTSAAEANIANPPRANVPQGLTPQQVTTVKGIAPQYLDSYWLPMVRELESNAGAADIRCAPEKSELAFGKWKGALASWVRSQPPAPGIYLARSTNEIEAVVIETLAPLDLPGVMLYVDVVVERGVVRGVR